MISRAICDRRAITIGGGRPLVLIAGPCVIESEDATRSMLAGDLRHRHACGVPFIFKASYDKANRTSGTSFRGPGLDEGLRDPGAVKDAVGVPILTDIHETDRRPRRPPRSPTSCRFRRSSRARPT